MNYKLHSLKPADEILLNEGKLLPLMEEFYTIQGEGFNTGKAAYFIRIGGCDVGCHWCDVKESWDANLHALTPIEKIITNVIEWKAQSVVVTGGEPLIYNLEALTQQLKAKNIEYCLKDTLDIECIKNYLTKHKIKFSRIAVAQIKLESNYLKHRRAKDDRNVTGMRVAAQRFTFGFSFRMLIF